MLIIHFQNFIFKIGIKLNLIFFIHLVLVTDIYTLSDPLKGRNPNSLLLQNGKLFITNVNGMFIYDTNLQNKDKEYIYYNKTINDDNIDDISSKTLIAQFQEENGMIICLVENAIYFFDYEGQFLYMDFLPDYDYSGSYFNLLTYKKVEDYYYYIITFIKDSSLYILYYKTNNVKNELIHQEIFKPFYFDFPKIVINGNALGCNIMNSDNEGYVLTCCFQTNTPHFIIIQSFIIERNFEPIGEDIYARVESPDAGVIHSITSNNGKRLLTCYRENNMVGYCFIFDIDSNKIIRNGPLISKCSDNYNKIKLFYINNYNKYMFACLGEDKKFTFMLLNENFILLNLNTFSNFNFEFNYIFNTFSIIYDSEETKYALIIDPWTSKGNENDNQLFTYYTEKHFITTNFYDDFGEITPPDPYEETPVSTEIIKLDSDNKYFLNVKDFYRSITVNEINGIIIDLLNEKHKIIQAKNNQELKKDLYALNVEEMPSGQLKYIIDGVEKNVILNERIYGEFKLKYIPSGVYPEVTKIIYSVYLKNISIASEQAKYWLTTCRKNCSCTTEVGNCPSCAEGYSSFETIENCILGSDI
jgi:hypothetical protein